MLAADVFDGTLPTAYAATGDMTVGTAYDFRLQVANPHTSSAATLPVAATPTVTAPINVTATPRYGDTVRVTWEMPPGAPDPAGGFAVDRSDDGGVTWTTVASDVPGHMRLYENAPPTAEGSYLYSVSSQGADPAGTADVSTSAEAPDAASPSQSGPGVKQGKTYLYEVDWLHIRAHGQGESFSRSVELPGQTHIEIGASFGAGFGTDAVEGDEVQLTVTAGGLTIYDGTFFFRHTISITSSGPDHIEVHPDGSRTVTWGPEQAPFRVVTFAPGFGWSNWDTVTGKMAHSDADVQVTINGTGDLGSGYTRPDDQPTETTWRVYNLSIRPLTPTISISSIDFDGTGAEDELHRMGFRLERTIPVDSSLDEGLTARIGVIGGTAEEGVDFETLPVEVTFLPGETLSEIIYINPVEDDIVEPDETIVLAVQQTNGKTYELGSPDIAPFAIRQPAPVRVEIWGTVVTPITLNQAAELAQKEIWDAVGDLAVDKWLRENTDWPKYTLTAVGNMATGFNVMTKIWNAVEFKTAFRLKVYVIYREIYTNDRIQMGVVGPLLIDNTGFLTSNGTGVTRRRVQRFGPIAADSRPRPSEGSS